MHQTRNSFQKQRPSLQGYCYSNCLPCFLFKQATIWLKQKCENYTAREKVKLDSSLCCIFQLLWGLFLGWQGADRYAGWRDIFCSGLLWSRCAACYSGCVSPLLQSPFIPTARTGFWEVRVGDVYSEGARRRRRRCLLLRLLQWGHCSVCQTGQFPKIFIFLT